MILPRARARSSPARGFNLLELLIAIGIITIGILTALLAFIGMLSSPSKAGNKAAGALLATSLLTEQIYGVMSNSVSKANFFAADSPPAAPLQGTVNLNGTIFTYSIAHQTLRNPATGTPLGAALPENRTKKAEITVWWWTNLPNDTRAGYGYLRTRMSRFINESGSL